MARTGRFELEEFFENRSRFRDGELPPRGSAGKRREDAEPLELGDSWSAQRFQRLNDEELFGRY